MKAPSYCIKPDHFPMEAYWWKLKETMVQSPMPPELPGNPYALLKEGCNWCKYRVIHHKVDTLCVQTNKVISTFQLNTKAWPGPCFFFKIMWNAECYKRTSVVIISLKYKPSFGNLSRTTSSRTSWSTCKRAVTLTRILGNITCIMN